MATSIDRILRDDADEPHGNVQDIAGPDEVTREEVEDVLYDHEGPFARSDSSGRRIAFGWTSKGMYINAVFTY